MIAEGSNPEEIKEALDLKKQQLVAESENITNKPTNRRFNDFDNKNHNLQNKQKHM